MGVTMELQPWVTLKGTSATAGVIQELDEWIDTSAYKSGVLQPEILKVAGGTLYVEGCDVQGGSFTTHASYAAGLSSATLVYLNKNVPYGASDEAQHPDSYPSECELNFIDIEDGPHTGPPMPERITNWAHGYNLHGKVAEVLVHWFNWWLPKIFV